MRESDGEKIKATESDVFSLNQLHDDWSSLSDEEKLDSFQKLPQGEKDDFFLGLKTDNQVELILALPKNQRRIWIRLLPPDDLADLIQAIPETERESIMNDDVDVSTRRELVALLAYAEDQAGGLMNPRFARIRPEMRVDEAIKYLYKQAQEQLETMRYIYVLDSRQKLLGIISLRDLFMAQGQKYIRDIMKINLVVASENMDQMALKELFGHHGLMAIPVVDAEGLMKGIVTVDDIVDVVEEEATEDIQRLGAVEVLDAPYLKMRLDRMIKKRAGWLTALFIGEMLTATAMGYYEHEIHRAVVLALFIPLIISSGGNSGSQASTLVVRAMALGEVKINDWWKVFARELIVGLSLGVILGLIGLLRISLWPQKIQTYGEHYFMVGLTVSISLVGVVLWGSLSGSMLPFVLRKLKFDPATASAPFVATLVDVSGLVIYFTVASILLKGILL